MIHSNHIPLFPLSLIPFILFLISCSQTATVTEQSFPDGKPKTVITYAIDDSTKNIRSIVEYYPDGNLRFEGEYRGGKKNGIWIYYFQNCNKWSEGSYKNGLADGKFSVWRENGSLRYEGYFSNGKKLGAWKFYDESGKLIKEEEF
ncbi:MAG: toxin-antitoxin system YwqK family antitoxin [Bacteroidetes bacterium]|nr:toxin-antitoxin system YwqK family antitoxin [Bacteroidota bacterium]